MKETNMDFKLLSTIYLLMASSTEVLYTLDIIVARIPVYLFSFVILVLMLPLFGLKAKFEARAFHYIKLFFFTFILFVFLFRNLIAPTEGIDKLLRLILLVGCVSLSLASLQAVIILFFSSIINGFKK